MTSFENDELHVWQFETFCYCGHSRFHVYILGKAKDTSYFKSNHI